MVQQQESHTRNRQVIQGYVGQSRVPLAVFRPPCDHLSWIVGTVGGAVQRLSNMFADGWLPDEQRIAKNQQLNAADRPQQSHLLSYYSDSCTAHRKPVELWL